MWRLTRTVVVCRRTVDSSHARRQYWPPTTFYQICLSTTAPVALHYPSLPRRYTASKVPDATTRELACRSTSLCDRCVIVAKAADAQDAGGGNLSDPNNSDSCLDYSSSSSLIQVFIGRRRHQQLRRASKSASEHVTHQSTAMTFVDSIIQLSLVTVRV